MKIFTLLMGMLFTLPSLANWQLDNDKSQVNFVTTKNSDASEVQHFTQLKGAISDQGDIQLTIDLTSVQTNIPIRNERLQQLLFETNLFPKATFTSSTDKALIEQLKVGDSTQVTLKGSINLHGLSQEINLKVQVIKLKGNAIFVSSLQPIIVKAKAFDLGEGIEKLKVLAALPSINHSVPVTFSLVFTQ